MSDLSTVSRPPNGDRSRQRIVLQIAVGILIGTGLLILMIPAPLPKPVRIIIFAIDIVAALTLWLLGRQKLKR